MKHQGCLKKGYTLYLVAVLLGSALLVLMYISNLRSQLTFQNTHFLHNRQAYYFLRASGNLIFREIAKAANDRDSELFASLRQTDNFEMNLKLSAEGSASLRQIAEYSGCSYPENILSVTDVKKIQNKVYSDSREKSGLISLSLSTIVGGTQFSLHSSKRFQLINDLPPVVNFFSVFSRRGFNGNINCCSDPKRTVTLNNNSGMQYFGVQKHILNLSAGLEEFLLPERKIKLAPDGRSALVTEYFCFSQSYAKYAGENLNSAVLCIFGSNGCPSKTQTLGYVSFNCLSVTADFAVSDRKLGDFTIISGDTSELKPQIHSLPASMENIFHPQAFYDRERDMLQVIAPDRTLFWRGEAHQFPLIEALVSKTTYHARSQEQLHNFQSNFLDHSQLDLSGNVVLFDGNLTLKNVRSKSPGILICTGDAVLGNISSSAPLTIACLGNTVSLEGPVDAYLCLAGPSVKVRSRRIEIQGGLFADNIFPDDYSCGGSITYNNAFREYFSQENYSLVLAGNFQELKFENR
ncbi:MAG: hypothetical protein PHW04_02185 [Candidatus Wallbacteria bacterium]|nr:hypothetical protein [Candidatus Wallbacteria bacterium]